MGDRERKSGWNLFLWAGEKASGYRNEIGSQVGFECEEVKEGWVMDSCDLSKSFIYLHLVNPPTPRPPSRRSYVSLVGAFTSLTTGSLSIVDTS